jgi:hypothetical protein
MFDDLEHRGPTHSGWVDPNVRAAILQPNAAQRYIMWLTSPRLLAVLLAIAVMPGVVRLIVSPTDSATSPDDRCLGNTNQALFPVTFVLAFTVFVLVYYVREVNDAFHIKSELKVQGTVSIMQMLWVLACGVFDPSFAQSTLTHTPYLTSHLLRLLLLFTFSCAYWSGDHHTDGDDCDRGNGHFSSAAVDLI